MKNYFLVSLCKNGILGGGIVVGSNEMTYHTGKVTVPKEIKKIEMKYQDICDVRVGWLFIFPTILIKLRNEKEYKFIVFSKKRFLGMLREKGVEI